MNEVPLYRVEGLSTTKVESIDRQRGIAGNRAMPRNFLHREQHVP